MIQSKVRRERMGHIDLAAPVAHIWFLKGAAEPHRQPARHDAASDLERVLYFESHVVIDPGHAPASRGELPQRRAVSQLQGGVRPTRSSRHGRRGDPRAAGEDRRRRRDAGVCATKMRDATSAAKRKKIAKRLKVVEAFRESGNKPEWMILDVIPVLPPELRPLVPLDGGRFATST